MLTRYAGETLNSIRREVIGVREHGSYSNSRRSIDLNVASRAEQDSK